jgi:ubiquinone/menaquinone biosynthesis C-methylase UbiE
VIGGDDEVDRRMNEAYFDGRAATYVHADWHVRYAERLVELAGLAPGSRVLDTATGTGFAALAAARTVGPGGHVIGVDVSAGMLEQAAQLRERAGLDTVTYIKADASVLDGFVDEMFDAVLCSAGLLYLPAHQALTAWHRVLKPNGLVGFSAMREGAPAGSQLFRECAAELGLTLADPMAPLGDEERCRTALHRARFTPLHLVAEAVRLPDSGVDSQWRMHSTSPHYPQIRTLSTEDLAVLKERFTDALRGHMARDGHGMQDVPVIYAFGRKKI